MDWPKAKNIIIVVLLAANLLIGANLIRHRADERQQEKLASERVVAFLQQQGMEVGIPIPQDVEKRPVLFLRLLRTEEAPAETSYRGTPIVVEPANVCYEIIGSGQQAAEVLPASEALLKLYARLGEEGSVEGRSIRGMDLVYLLHLEEVSYAAQDTAVPAWRLQVDDQLYYVSVY